MAVEGLRAMEKRSLGKGDAILEIEGLGLDFGSATEGVPVLEEVNLSVAPNEFVAVFGPSGAGKSTLLRVAAGLLAPSTGTVTLHPQHLNAEHPFGFVFQEPRLLPWRSVLRNVEYGIEGRSVSREERRRRALEALDLVGLAEKRDDWPHQLSGGQRQRVGIARALAVGPDILLMDEPFSSLDAVTRRTLQQELLQIWKTARTSILFVTHDLEEALRLSDRLVLLAGRPATVIHEYRIGEPRPRSSDNPEIRRLLRSIHQDLESVSPSRAGKINPY